ncbi:MAG: aldehyde dehydrogenase, partial [Acidobacteriota bacterium]
AETALDAPSAGHFLDAAVDFVNERLWGTLSAALIVHPRSLRDPVTAQAVERALDRLRYGTVALNHWPALGYGLASTSWGAYPGHSCSDIQSGIGVVHNTCMLSQIEKTVLRGPFRVRPTPPWFVTHPNPTPLARRLTAFEATPGLGNVLGVLRRSV